MSIYEFRLDNKLDASETSVVIIHTNKPTMMAIAIINTIIELVLLVNLVFLTINLIMGSSIRERTKATKLLTKKEQEMEDLKEIKYREKVRTIAGNSATRSFIMYGG